MKINKYEICRNEEVTISTYLTKNKHLGMVADYGNIQMIWNTDRSIEAHRLINSIKGRGDDKPRTYLASKLIELFTRNRKFTVTYVSDSMLA